MNRELEALAEAIDAEARDFIALDELHEIASMTHSLPTSEVVS